MMRPIAALLAAGLLAGLSAPAFCAEDGHGNAANPERSVPNTGGVAGGPAHRDTPTARAVGKDGKPVHSDKDGQAHGHSHDKK
jgi:hypothetical protein